MSILPNKHKIQTHSFRDLATKNMALEDSRLLCVTVRGGEGKTTGFWGICFTPGTEQNA